MIILFMAFVGIVTLAVQLKTTFAKNKVLKEELQKQKYEFIVDNALRIYLYIGLILFSLFSVIYGAYINDQPSIALGVILVFVGIGEMFSYNVKNKFYYNDDRFINNGEMHRYRSIKKITVKKSLGIKTYTLYTFDGQGEQISLKAISIIQKYSKVKITK